MRNSVYIFYEHTARSTELDEEIEERDSPMPLKIINKIHRQTGLYYYGVRYYNPSISIFISADPLVEQTMDAYGYTYQNPINLVDPTGMAAEGNCPNCDTPINEDAPIMLSDIVREGFKNKEYESPRLQYSYNETYSRRLVQCLIQSKKSN